MDRVRKIRAEIAENDSVSRFDKMGCDMFLGHAKFVSKNEVEVNGQKLKFLKCAIATGASPFIPPIPGQDQIKCFTSENIWNLDHQPKRILFVGSGPIGCELGQAFQRLGSEVTMLEIGDKFLPREDKDASNLVEEQMRKDGVNIKL
jgi:pyruvate/2-oxoglutarate dehydrogenase complex dihydrolipoamide dehydrogenase (E3) component